MTRARRMGRAALALAVATASWLPCLHLLFRPRLDSAPLLQQQLQQIDVAAHAPNPEWDLMGRTFVAWALANRALREPSQSPAALERIDRTLTSIVAREREQGFRAYLLP